MIERGYCQCGCGRKTDLAEESQKDRGWVKGQPKRFIHGHHARLRKAENHPSWKGGRITDKHGYVSIKIYEHRFYGTGYIKEHRLVMSEHLNRPLSLSEHIHHINGNRSDNRLENLELLSPSAHTRNHRLGKKWTKEQLRKLSESHTKVYIPEQTLRRLVYKQGLSYSEIARQYHCTYSCIKAKCHKAGIRIGVASQPVSIPESVLQYLFKERKLPKRKIAQICGCTRSCIDDKLRKLGFIDSRMPSICQCPPPAVVKT